MKNVQNLDQFFIQQRHFKEKFLLRDPSQTFLNQTYNNVKSEQSFFSNTFEVNAIEKNQKIITKSIPKFDIHKLKSINTNNESKKNIQPIGEISRSMKQYFRSPQYINKQNKHEKRIKNIFLKQDIQNRHQNQSKLQQLRTQIMNQTQEISKICIFKKNDFSNKTISDKFQIQQKFDSKSLQYIQSLYSRNINPSWQDIQKAQEILKTNRFFGNCNPGYVAELIFLSNLLEVIILPQLQPDEYIEQKDFDNVNFISVILSGIFLILGEVYVSNGKDINCNLKSGGFFHPNYKPGRYANYERQDNFSDEFMEYDEKPAEIEAMSITSATILQIRRDDYERIENERKNLNYLQYIHIKYHAKFLDNFTLKVKHQFFKFSHQMEFEMGDALIKTGQILEHLYIIYEGKVTLNHQLKKNLITLREVSYGSLIGSRFIITNDDIQVSFQSQENMIIPKEGDDKRHLIPSRVQVTACTDVVKVIVVSRECWNNINDNHTKTQLMQNFVMLDEYDEINKNVNFLWQQINFTKKHWHVANQKSKIDKQEEAYNRMQKNIFHDTRSGKKFL